MIEEGKLGERGRGDGAEVTEIMEREVEGGRRSAESNSVSPIPQRITNQISCPRSFASRIPRSHFVRRKF